MKAKAKRKIQSALNKIQANSLQEWLDEASKIDGLQEALNGMYCGKEGSIHVECVHGLWLHMGWYTVSTTPKVEYAYVS